MFDLIWALPLSLAYFWRGHRDGLKKSPFRYVRVCMLAFALLRGRRTIANVARWDGEGRHKSSYTRFFAQTSLPMYRLQQELTEATVALAKGLKPPRGRWYVLIDSTQSQHESPEAPPQGKKKGQRGPRRGQRLENAVRHRGGGKCSRIMVWGVLYDPETGARIPLPRKIYRTKEWCRRQGRRFRTQVERAADLVHEAARVMRALGFPADVEVVVVNDSAFTAKPVVKACGIQGFHYIGTLDSNRVVVDDPHRPNVGKLAAELVQSQNWDQVVTLHKPAKRGRGQPGQRAPGSTRHFNIHAKRCRISKLGEVQVVFSQAVGHPNGCVKIIVSSDPTLSGEEVCRRYALRWEIELMFKELKSDLGLDHAQMRSYRGWVRHVDLVWLTFTYLEWLRLRGLRQGGPERRLYEQARTRQMTYFLAREVRQAQVAWVRSKLRTARGRRELEEALERVVEIL